MGIIFTFVMGLLMSFEPITDNDWFWHYVIGHYIDVNKNYLHGMVLIIGHHMNG